MAKDEMHTVMDTVIGDCRRAYESRTPLIMIDTVEYELVEEIALSGALVAPAKRAGEPYLDMELAYYEFIGSRRTGSQAARTCSLVRSALGIQRN